MCPHGMSVIVNAPAVFRHTSQYCPTRHLHAAELLGASIADCDEKDAGELLASTISDMMNSTGMPNGISDIGYCDTDIDGLVDGAFAQQRLLTNAPCPVEKHDLQHLYQEAMSYW
jgi:alcohol dehydrogenase class IV